VTNTSSWDSSEFETMTFFWSTTSPIPTHYRCSSKSFCNNSSIELTKKQSAGLSGPKLDARNISFIWSQIYRDASTGSGFRNENAGRTIFEGSNTRSSYRFVPLNHSIDYSNVTSAGAGNLTDDASISRAGLFAMMAFGRDGYRSVKPPQYLFAPEDGSAIVDSPGLTAAFSASALINAL
jgi:hypothetical protein